MKLLANLVANLIDFLNPAICRRCGLVWSNRPGQAGSSKALRHDACPCCGFAAGLQAHSDGPGRQGGKAGRS